MYTYSSHHPITPRQKEVLDTIRQTLEDRGYPPSLREIARDLKINGVRAVQKHIEALSKKGFLKKGDGPRALEVVSCRYGRSFPIIGSVAAGKPILAEENVVGHLALDPSLSRSKDSFFLKVKGESMVEAGILDGDMVLVRPQEVADSGEIVVALKGEEATVKRLLKKEDGVWLKPENPAFNPIKISEESDATFRIIGKVTGVFRVLA